MHLSGDRSFLIGKAWSETEFAHIAPIYGYDEDKIWIIKVYIGLILKKLLVSPHMKCQVMTTCFLTKNMSGPIRCMEWCINNNQGELK